MPARSDPSGPDWLDPARPPAGLSSRLLLALLAPGSAEAAVCRVQDSLFSRYGLASAVALAPFIPVLFLPPAGLPGGLASLGRGIPSPRFSVTGTRWEGGGLWLTVESGGAWKALREEARAAAASDAGTAAAPLFPETEGFPLGCWEVPAEERRGISVEAPVLRFSSCLLALARITVGESRREWWTEVYLDTLEERPLRGTPRG
jgi:hypothetical protein